MISVPPFIPEHPFIEQSEQFDKLAVIGVSARTAGRRLRDSLFVEEPEYDKVLAGLKKRGEKSVILIATCERFDFVLGDHKSKDTDYYLSLMASEAKMTVDEIRKQSYIHTGFNALRHVFAISSSLDSVVVGEPQILGQVKDCHRQSRSIGLTDGFLDDVIQASLVAAKRVRTETTIAQQPITLTSSALQVARGIHGDLSRCSVLLVGGGEVGELLCGEFNSVGIRALRISHPRGERSKTAVFRLGGEASPWSEIHDLAIDSDIILSSLGGGEKIFTKEIIGRCLKQRKRKPIFIIDTTGSRDVAVEVNELDGAFSYNLEDLENVAKQGKKHRENAMMAAWKVLGQEMQSFIRNKIERQAAPTISIVRKHFEALRQQVLTECAGNDGDVDAATRLLINRLLHNPQVVLKETAREDPEAHLVLEETLCRLFRIESFPTNLGNDAVGSDEVKED
ncbi:glutamyl-tRNA reductase [Kiloniella antarctica]|uniref:Glutamyl-tRNA reductase n=1 Tax=Kiloniella antarctica TaxID=1550907 RepID=A0ABW5BL81_9PROT